MVDVSHSGVDLIKHKMYWIHYRFESCPDYKIFLRFKYILYICETNKINMKKFFYSILFLITFTLLFVQVGSTVVNMIMTLIPMSAQEWFPLIKLIIWVFTFSFNLMLTIFITYLIAAVVSLIFK